MSLLSRIRAGPHPHSCLAVGALGLSDPLLVLYICSGSMEPAIHRGDLLLLSNRYSTPLVSGDIVVYKLPGRDVPIVHRIIKVHEEHDTAEVDILTKGDNNLPDDRELYGDRKWLSRDMVVGRAFAFLPRAGMVRGRCGRRERWMRFGWRRFWMAARSARRGCEWIRRIAAAPSVSLLASCADRSATLTF